MRLGLRNSNPADKNTFSLSVPTFLRQKIPICEEERGGGTQVRLMAFMCCVRPLARQLCIATFIHVIDFNLLGSQLHEV